MRSTVPMTLAVASLLSLVNATHAGEGSDRPFVIHVVDSETSRGVPLVELTTTAQELFVTDSNGITAIREPHLLGRKVFFHVRSHGHEFPADGFGMRGRALDVTTGGSAELRIERRNLAERLYRVTGSGIYRDSVIAGVETPIRQPLLNASVTGQDSVFTAIYRGRIFWIWGDTNRAGYPLGRFHTTAARSSLPGKGGLDPSKGVDLEYFTAEDGFARDIAPLDGEGPTWLSGLVVLRERSGEIEEERLFAHYVKVRNTRGGGFETYEQGLVKFDDARERFVIAARFDEEQPFPHGAHPLPRRVGGEDWIYFCDPFPLVRVRANAAALGDQEAYEAFTPLAPGERDPESRRLDRDGDGALVWSWKRSTAPIHPREQERLVRAGALKREACRLTLRDADGGKPIVAHRGSVAWNEHRERWVMIFCELGGSSMLGEIWYAEAAESGTGPDADPGTDQLGRWSPARKIVTHDRYSFYNPRHHPFLDGEGGRFVYFEGTYTKQFSGAETATPRYDYNQVMYRLDLDRPELALPVPGASSAD